MREEEQEQEEKGTSLERSDFVLRQRVEVSVWKLLTGPPRSDAEQLKPEHKTKTQDTQVRI